ncbi:hypothetical protein [Rossellomorea marisflavi]|uniref:hypothetical protein n=1 Tax=Rossellomorea marisflavi TaxID=189381 RepID=UPI003FA15F72
MNGIIEVKQCYTNIFYVVMRNVDKFANGEWKVAYGYMNILPNQPFMARHCFIVNDKGEAIDPTIVETSSFDGDDPREYVSFHMFDDMEDYLGEVEKNNNVPDLIKPFWDLENKQSEPWAREHGRVLIR